MAKRRSWWSNAALRQAIALTEGGGAWWDADAVFHADYAAGRFRLNGVNYGNEAAFNTAIGFTKSGITRQTETPVVTGSDLVSNGAFTDMTGWTVGGSAPLGSIASVSGEGRLTGGGGNQPTMYQALTVQQSHAYKISGRQRFISGTAGASIRWSSANALSTNPVYIAQTGGVTFVDSLVYGHAPATTMYVGGRHASNSDTSVTAYDDIAVAEVLPFTGFTAAELAALIRGTTPSAASGDKIVFQADPGEVNNGSGVERNYTRLVWDASEHLRLIVRSADSEVANLDLGVVSASTDFSVAFSAATNAFSASLDGQTAVTDSAGVFPGVAFLRIGRGFTGNTWDGDIAEVILY